MNGRERQYTAKTEVCLRVRAQATGEKKAAHLRAPLQRLQVEGLGAGLFQGLVAGGVQLVGEHEAAGLDVRLVRDLVAVEVLPPIMIAT
jgi:hypothetical protein